MICVNIARLADVSNEQVSVTINAASVRIEA
jgi:hypothetical protein